MDDSKDRPGGELLSFGGHLDVLRKILLRVSFIVVCVAAIVFAFKERTFDVILAPGEWNFVTYRWIEALVNHVVPGFKFDEFSVDLIATDLTSQFMSHLTVAIYLGLLISSPYIVYELFRFVSPALYERERRYSSRIVCVVYLLFVLGTLMSYFIIFPISFRFLGTYSVAGKVHSAITLDSYISTFTTLTLMMGLVFQLPVIASVLARMGFISGDFLAYYRRYAILVIMIVAAVITPPDLMTMLLVGIPLYLLYEVSIMIVRRVDRRAKLKHP